MSLSENDLRVTLLQYLSGKSTELERAHFEERLLADQEFSDAAAVCEQEPVSYTHLVDIALLQHELLEEHSVLLSYWIGSSQSYRWSVTMNSISVDVLPPRSKLDHMIIPLERMLRSRRSKLVSGEDIATYALQQKSYENQLQRALSLSLIHI